MSNIVSAEVRPKVGRRRFAAVGYVLRVVKALPAPMRERVLDASVGGVGSTPPPFADVLRLVEAAGGMPEGSRWRERLLGERPHLGRVDVSSVADDVDGRVRARLYLPPPGARSSTDLFVWVHGGAFVMGGLDQKEAHWPSLELAASGIRVLSVDYRLCLRGVHFPEPLDDVVAAWRWAVANSDRLGVDPTRVHLGGASAGGCLAAGAALRLRDAGEQVPASLFLGYPVLEGDLPPASPDMQSDLASVTLVPQAWVEDMFANWAGPAPWSDPYVSPAVADLVGLPATYVLTCGRDLLRRSSVPFVERLRAAGVPVCHDVFAQSEHAPLDRPGTADGELALDRLRCWLTAGVPGMGEALGSPPDDRVS